MRQDVTVTIVHPTQRSGSVEGFRFLWAYLVNGYRSDRHCKKCLYGRAVPELSASSDSIGATIVLPLSAHHPYGYICGVASGPIAERRTRNLHLPLRYARGEIVEIRTYNGYTLTASNAQQISIPALPDDWQGLVRSHARCKNFQFAVEMFGYPAAPKRGRPASPTR